MAYRKRGLINRERKSITNDPEEERNTDDSKRTLSLGNLKGTLSLKTLKSLRTVNDLGPQKNLFMMIYPRKRFRFYTKIFVYFKRALKI